MTTYPGAIDNFRDVENLPGVVYEPTDSRTLFAEDTRNSFDAITAIETTLGANPQGQFESVANRIVSKYRYITVAKTGVADILTADYDTDSEAIIAGVSLAETSGLRHLVLIGDETTEYTYGDEVVTLPSDFVFESQPGVLHKMRANGAGNNPVAIRNSDTTNGNLNITIKNIIADGNGENQLAGQSVGGTFFNFVGVQNLVYRNVNVKNSRRFNSFVGAVAGTPITGTVTATKDNIIVTGSGTLFTSELAVGQRLRAVSGNMSSPIQSIESNTSLTLASPWPHDTESAVTATELMGVTFEVYDSVFGNTYENDTFGGGGWDYPKVDNCTFENAEGYGYGTTSQYGGNVSNIYAHGNINGLGLERVNASNFSNVVTEYNSSKGVNLINGSNDNRFVNVLARFNADGFYDSNTSTTKGQNRKNQYINCVAEFNTNNGFNIGGLYKPTFLGCTARNNSTSGAGTYYGFVFQAANSYKTEGAILRGCRGYDDQTSKTQTRDIYFAAGGVNADVDFSGFDFIHGLTAPNYAPSMKIVNNSGKRVAIISGSTRATNNYETLIFCNQDTFAHLLPRLDGIVDGHKVKFIYNGAGTPAWTFARSSSDAFGTLEDYAKYPQNSKFWIEWTWDNTVKLWAITGCSGMTDLLAKSDVTWTSVPATSSSAGIAGQRAYDANYLYICTATNTWKRIAITTW